MKLVYKILCITPKSINFNKVLNQLMAIKEVREIHNLHIWEIGEKKLVSCVHLVVNSNQNEVLK